MPAATASAQVDRATLTGIVQGSVGRRDSRGPGHDHEHRHRCRRQRLTTTDRGHLSRRRTWRPASTSWRPKRPGSSGSSRRSRSRSARARGSTSRCRSARSAKPSTVEGVTPLLNTESAVARHRRRTATRWRTCRWRSATGTTCCSRCRASRAIATPSRPAATSAGRTGGVSVHGNRRLQNNFLLDGVDNNSISTNVQELSTQVSRPSIDAIGEFKVVTSPFAAEYGRAPGGAIVVTTKSGTNAIRGTAYDYFRDEQFDSRSFFAKRAQPAESRRTTRTSSAAMSAARSSTNRAFFFGDCRRHAHRAGRAAHRPRDDRRRAQRRLLLGHPRSADRASRSRTTRFPTDRIDPVARSIMALRAAAEHHRQQQLHPPAQRRGRRRALSLARPMDSPSGNDNVFVRYIYSGPRRDSCPASSAACSTARRRRRGAATS